MTAPNPKRTRPAEGAPEPGQQEERKEPVLTMLGSTKISGKLRITIPIGAAKSLGVDDGDFLIFYVDQDGQHIVKKG